MIIPLSLFFFHISSQAVYSSISLNATVVSATNCPFAPGCLKVTWFTYLNSTSIFLTSPITAPYTVIINNTVDPSTLINTGSVSYCYPFIYGTDFTFILVDDLTGSISTSISVATVQVNVLCPVLPTKIMLDPYLSDEIAMTLLGDNIFLTSAGNNLQQKFSFTSGVRLTSNNLVIRASKSMIIYGQTLIIPTRSSSSQGFIFQLDLNLTQIQKVPIISASKFPSFVKLGYNSGIIYAGYNDGIIRGYDFSQNPAVNVMNISAHVGDFGAVLTAPGFLVTCGASDYFIKKWALNGTLLLSISVGLVINSAVLSTSYDFVIVGTTRLIKYDLNTGAFLFYMYDPLISPSYATLGAVYSLNVTGNFVFLAGLDSVIRQWDYTSGELICRYYGGYNFRYLVI